MSTCNTGLFNLSIGGLSYIEFLHITKKHPESNDVFWVKPNSTLIPFFMSFRYPTDLCLPFYSSRGITKTNLSIINAERQRLESRKRAAYDLQKARGRRGKRKRLARPIFLFFTGGAIF
jgi:hypothetical protein